MVYRKKHFPIVIFTLIAIFLSSCSTKKTEIARSNVLFIAVDDLRPSLGCYGDSLAISPNIDLLAATGIVFNKAYCQQAVCNPSRASIMTGLRPDQIGVTNLYKHFREKFPDIITLPQLFSKNGYEAVAIGKIYHGSKKAQDSISWTKPSLLNLSIKADEYALPKNKTGKKESSFECADLEDSSYEDGMIADLAIRQLREFKESGKPFFLAVGFKKPHLPFSAPKKYWDLYDSDIFNLGSAREKPVGTPPVAFHNSQELRGYRDIPESGTIAPVKEKKLWNGYYACVSFIDAQVGKLMATLADLGMGKNTVIVLWGDHGFHLGEQGLWCKSTNFELDARIPLILSVPQMENSGAISESIVEAVDIYPTLIDLCGLKSETELSGISLKPILDNPDSTLKYAAYSQFIRPYEALSSSKKVTHMGYSIRTKQYRCTIWVNTKTDSIEFKEFYDLSTGIEKQNLSGDLKYLTTESDLIEKLKEYKNGNRKYIVNNSK